MATSINASPILISNVSDLENVGNDLSGSYILGNNIDATGFDFSPIGDTASFTGTFDGAGHTIHGLTINSGASAVGLFTNISPSGSVRSLNLTGISISATAPSEGVGAIAGVNSGTISGTTVSGTINAGEGVVGGLAGSNWGKISLATSSVTVVGGSDSQIGGLVGDNAGTIQQSSSLGTVTGKENSDIGGLVGFFAWPQLGSLVTQSYAAGDVTGGSGSRIGGLVGWNFDRVINQSYALGSVTGVNSGYLGGLVGENGGGCRPCFSSLDQSYSTGHVSDPGSQNIGGLIGENYPANAFWGQGIATNSYWDSQSSGQAAGVGTGDVSGITGQVSAQLKSATLPGGFDSAVWLSISGHYPQLQWQTQVPSALPPPSSSQLASVVSAWTDYIELAKTSNPQAEADKLINCPSDLSCDVDATAHEYQTNIQTAAQKAGAAATSSEDLILETLPDPASKLDVITWVATHAGSLIDNLVSLFDLLAGGRPSTDKQISITNVAAHSYSFETLALGGNYFDIIVDAQLTDSELANLILNEPIPNEFELPSGELAYGEASVISAIDPPEIGVVQIEFREFVPNSVPEAPTWLIMFGGLIAFCVACGSKIRRGQKAILFRTESPIPMSPPKIANSIVPIG